MNPSHAPSRSPARIGLSLLVLALAAALVALAWPRLQASVSYLPVDKALARHWSGDTPPPNQLATLSGRAREALQRHNATPALLALDSGILATQSTGLQDLGVVLVMSEE